MPPKSQSISKPKGTRDLYPAQAARRRWLMERWREVSIAHGFEEVDGPSFEQSQLYAVKSGEGILGELFQAFSGKSPKDVQAVMATGRGPFALRPEFTPTLARMYAAQANSLPKPCKWFMAGPFFRAERPQRGRLREFLQWNVDVLGLDIPQEKWKADDAESQAEVAMAKARMDAEVIGCCIDFLHQVGLRERDVQVRVNDRKVVTDILRLGNVGLNQIPIALQLLDRANKIDRTLFEKECHQLDLPYAVMELLRTNLHDPDSLPPDFFEVAKHIEGCLQPLVDFKDLLPERHQSWIHPDIAVVRGLAYYTGTVFEVIADGERAVAGGGRYDNLIELFGGPPTPAVGFAMGDVVLSLLLQDKGLMPSDDELMGLTGQQPDVFVLGNGSEEAQAMVRPVVAMLRTTDAKDASLRMLHVRHSYKTTKKTDKLLNEAKKLGSRFAVIIEDDKCCTVKNLRTGEQWADRVELDCLAEKLHAAR